MTWTLVLTIFLSNQEPKQIIIPDWQTERHCYLAGSFLQEEHQKEKNVTWTTVQCSKGGNS